MNRPGGHDIIMSAITRLRAAVPDITIRTSIITGYPGETEEEFNELAQFVKDIRLERLGCFAYSEEELHRCTENRADARGRKRAPCRAYNAGTAEYYG